MITIQWQNPNPPLHIYLWPKERKKKERKKLQAINIKLLNSRLPHKWELNGASKNLVTAKYNKLL